MLNFHIQKFYNKIYNFKKGIVFRNKILELILGKIPDKFMEISQFFREIYDSNNFISEAYILIKKDSKLIFPYLLNIYSLINSSEYAESKKYQSKEFLNPFHSLQQFKYTMNKYIIKNILKLIKDIHNFSGELNLTEQEIFIDKIFSLKLLNYSFNDVKMKYIINKINTLFYEENYENLFSEILKENITNKFVFDYVFNSLTEMQIKKLFEDNKSLVIKCIYGYSEINGFYFIQILLYNLEKYFQDKKFIKNLIFPPNNNDEFNEIIKYFEDKKIFEKTNLDFINDNEEERKIKNEVIQMFLFNYSQTQYRVYNYETRAFLFKYYSSSINLMNLFPELFYCYTNRELSQFRPKIIIKRNKQKIIDLNNSYKRRYGYSERYKNRTKYSYDIFYSKSYNRVYPNYYIYKSFIFLNNYKNKELIKSLNNFYYSIYEFIEFMYTKTQVYIQKLNSMESIIFRFYIIIFVFNKIPYKLKHFLCILRLKENNNSFNYDELIKEDNLEDKSNINEIEIFIILTLLEIKGEINISIKHFFSDFYAKIQENCNKFKQLKIPEMNIRHSDDEKFIVGF